MVAPPGVPFAPKPAQRLLETAQAIIGGRRLRAAFAATAAGLALTALALVVADALIGLPELLRTPALPVVLAGSALAVVLIGLFAARLRPDPDAATRQTENATGDQLRKLATAIALEGMPGELAAAGAARLAASLPVDGLAARLPRGASLRWILGVVTVALTALLLHLVMPRLYPTVVPRFLDPHGDHPPFSLTELTWATAPDRVRAGDDARFEVDVGNLTPAVAKSLVLRSDAGAQVALYQIGATRFAGELARLEAPLTAWVEGGGTRTHYHQVAIDPVPVLTSLDMTLESPRYALLEPEQKRVKPGEQGHFDALPGSSLRLKPSSNRPLSALHLLREGVKPLRLELRNGIAECPDVQPGVYAVALEATDGISGHAVTVLRVDARVDQPPTAHIIAPGRDAMATPTMKIPLQLEADDDLGLVQVLKVSGYNDLSAPELRRRVSGRTWRSDGVLDLATLGVAPGDLITITLVARDSKPGDGQLSAAASRTITIISEEEFNASLLRHAGPDALERKYSPLVHQLSDMERKLAELKRNRAGLSPDALDHALAELAAKAAEFQEHVTSMHREHPLFAVEPDLQKKLSEGASEIADAVGKARAKNKQNGGAGLGSVTKPGSDTDADQEQVQAAISKMLEHDLALLSKLARMQRLANRLIQITDAEENTVQRMTPLAEHRHLADSERVQLRELGDQEQTLAEAIDLWLSTAPKLANDLRQATPSDPAKPDQAAIGAASRAADQADAMTHALAEAGVADLKRASAAAARAGDGDQAQRLAKTAYERLRALVPKGRKSNPIGQACQGECLAIHWSNCLSTLGQLGGFGFGASPGKGMGGQGNSGLGLSLGYGQDDEGGSDAAASMDLYGPENLGDSGGMHDDNGKDSVADMAVIGGAPPHQGTGYRKAVRATTGTAHTTLTNEEQQVIDTYFRELDAQDKP